MSIQRGPRPLSALKSGFVSVRCTKATWRRRKKLVSPPPAIRPTADSHRIVQPDLTAQRQQLSQLETQRREIKAWLDQRELEHADNRSRHANLIRQRDAILAELEQSEYAAPKDRWETELASLNRDYQVLLKRVEEDRRYIHPTPNPLLVRAAKLLSRCTAGNLVQVFLGQTGELSEFQIRNQLGKVLNFTALDAGQQDTVYLCLALAACETLSVQGLALPMLIDDAFLNFSRDRVNSVLELYNEVAANGQQLIVLTQHQYLADRLPGVPFFELPPLTGIPNTFTRPERTSSPEVLPARNFAAYDLPYFADPTPAFAPAHPVHDATSGSDYILPYSTPVAYQPSEFDSRAVPGVATVAVDAFGDRLGYTVGIDDDTRLERIQIFDGVTIRALLEANIVYVGQLLELNPAGLPEVLLDHGVSPEQIDRWQAQVWLLFNVPGLRVNDARVLVACGVTEPEHLATSDARQLHERISRFLGSPEGFRFLNSAGPDRHANSINLDRIEGWYRALDRTRSRWQVGEGFFGRHSRRRQLSASRPAASRPAASRPAAVQFEPQQRPERQRPLREESRAHYLRRDRSSRSSRDASDVDPRVRTKERREPVVARTPRMRTFENRTSAPALEPVAHKTTTVDTRKEPAKPHADIDDSKFRFYLDLKDHIEAAPSIGPKTAERFEKIGVFTVADFLKQTAELMAAKIKYKRISADVVRQWQHQCRLVCRIPNLRGHDVQLLVACGYTEAESIAAMQPAKLYAEIEPFSDTKEGLKIIRNGKKPDLEEVTNWITWAEHTRSLQAA